MQRFNALPHFGRFKVLDRRTGSIVATFAFRWEAEERAATLNLES